MPLYEYKCNSCGQVFELIQRFSDAPITQHESCGGQVERLLSAPALVFKGSGFYITDYQKSGGASNSGSGKNDTGKSDSTSESKSESKTDSKGASKSTSSGDTGSSSSASTSTSSTASSEKK